MAVTLVNALAGSDRLQFALTSGFVPAADGIEPEYEAEPGLINHSVAVLADVGKNG